jgi:hypothetical protein
VLSLSKKRDDDETDLWSRIDVAPDVIIIRYSPIATSRDHHCDNRCIASYKVDVTKIIQVLLMMPAFLL